jgi:hypothetical protein
MHMMAAMMLIRPERVAMVIEMTVVMMMDVTSEMMMRRPRGGRRNEGKYCN